MRWCFSWYRAVAPGGDSADGVCACSLTVVLVKAKWMVRVTVTVIPVAVLLRGISKALITILVSIAMALENNDVVLCRWWWARQSAAMERNNLIAGVK